MKMVRFNSNCDGELLKYFFKILFIFRERGRKVSRRGRETLICQRNPDWLPLILPQLGTWPVTQACALTGI